MAKVYYSPFGGEVFAVCTAEGGDDDQYRFRELMGQAKSTTVGGQHPIIQHIEDVGPTNLQAWRVRDLGQGPEVYLHG